MPSTPKAHPGLHGYSILKNALIAANARHTKSTMAITVLRMLNKKTDQDALSARPRGYIPTEIFARQKADFGQGATGLLCMGAMKKLCGTDIRPVFFYLIKSHELSAIAPDN